MLKKKLLFSILGILLTSVYFGVSFYFSSLVINPEYKSLEQDKANQNINSFADLNLPNPIEKNFQSGNLSLASWYFSHPKRKNCGVVLLHGFRGTRWGAIKYAPVFWKQGCDIFMYDHRRHGASSGKYITFGYHEKQDLENAISFFVELSKLSPERIGVLGESMGAATALQYAGLKNPKLAFIIAESPFQDLHSIVGKRALDLYGRVATPFIPFAYFLTELRADMKVDEVSPILAARSIQIPTLIIHSEADDYTPAEHSKAIFENLNAPQKKLVLTDWGSKHAKSINDNYEKFEKIVLDFLKEIGYFQYEYSNVVR